LSVYIVYHVFMRLKSKIFVCSIANRNKEGKYDYPYFRREEI